MTQERKEQVDNELSFIISCLYQRGEDVMAQTLEDNINELWDYINELENK
jgi:hypothetical protein